MKQAKPISFFSPSASFADKLAALGGPAVEFTAEQIATQQIKSREAAARQDRERRAQAIAILKPDTMVRTDIYGWRFDPHRVVSDDGNSEFANRRVVIERVNGPRAGEQIALRRDRVRPSPGQ